MPVQFLRVAAAMSAVASLSAVGFADDGAANPDQKALLEYVKKLESRVDQLEQEKQWPLDQVRGQSGSALEAAVKAVNLSGYMEFQFGWNVRHGGRNAFRGDTLGFNQGHATSNDESSFSFQNLQLLADKPLTTMNSTGFRVRAQFGEVSRFDNRDANFTNTDHAFDVREAYMSWRMEGWGGMTNYVDLSVGKFDSPIGLESPDNTMNWEVTRGPAQANLLPVTHTGIRTVWPWQECMKTTLYLVNGWDNVRDTSDGKTVILSHEMGKYPDFMNSTLTINLSYGNEGSIGGGTTTIAGDGNKNKLAELIWRGELDPETMIALDGIWDRWDHSTIDNHGDIRTRVVKSLHGYLKHDMSKETWIGVRAGYYADSGFAGTLGRDLRGYDASVTLGWALAADLALALELRHDHASDSDPFFSKAGDSMHSQDTVTASAVYRF